MNHLNVPIMIAPNGARLNRNDHPGVPVTIEQTIECAVACQLVGAQALHAHVRDSQQKHLLDATAYQALLDMAANRLGADFPVQITTEAFGTYTADEQIKLVETLKPRFASIAMREILRDEQHMASGQAFYQWCTDERVGVQHILYGQSDLQQFLQYQSLGVIPSSHNAVLMVIGRYTNSKVADTTESQTVINELAASQLQWMLCAFGITETECLVQAAMASGGVRVGFENNVQHVDGSVATDNAERVSALCSALTNNNNNNNNNPLDEGQLYRLLGGL